MLPRGLVPPWALDGNERATMQYHAISVPLVMCTLWLLLAQPGPAQAQIQQGPVSGNALEGARLYYEHGCHGCHGFNAQTGRADLVGAASNFMVSVEVFTAFLRARQDVDPLFPSADMPNYPANALSDAEVEDVYAYIRALEVDTPAVDDIPAFQAILRAAERSYQP